MAILRKRYEIENIARLFSPGIITADDTERVKMHMLAAVTTKFHQPSFSPRGGLLRG
jgi:hypothetical protein